MKITEKRRLVLAALAAQDWQRDGCLTAYEVAVKCRQKSAAWAYAPLSALARFGLVESAGTSWRSVTWRITDAGRVTLRQEEASR